MRKTIEIPQEIKNKVETVVIETLLTLQQKFPTKSFDIPEIKYDLSGKCAGQMLTDNLLKKSYIRLNSILLMENLQHFLNVTIQHELAHYAEHIIFKTSGHGWNWKYIMQYVLGINPERCHQLNVANSTIARKTFKYVCGCNSDNVHNITLNRHNKILNGKRYFCGVCHVFIKPLN